MKLVKLSFAVLFLPLCFLTGEIVGQNQDTKQSEQRELKPGIVIEREMNATETHHYKFDLKANEFFQVQVEQKGIDVTLKLLDSNGQTLAVMDSPNEKEGFETLTFVSKTAGRFALEVGGFDKKAGNGRYIIKRAERRAATADDTRRIEVEKIFLEAIKARDEKQNDTALRKFDEALKGWTELNDQYLIKLTKREKGSILLVIAEAKTVIGERKKALELLNEALPLWTQSDFKLGQAITLVRMGFLHAAAGEQQTALELYVQAVPLFEQTGNAEGFVTVLNNISVIYLTRGDNPKALEFLNRAVPFLKELSNKQLESTVLNNIGAARLAMGNYQESLNVYKETLELRRKSGDKPGEAATLIGLGVLYYSLQQTDEALKYLEQGLALARELNNKEIESKALVNIGAVYDAKNEKRKAIDYYNLAKLAALESGDLLTQAQNQVNMASTYYSLSYFDEALDLFQEALPQLRKAGDRQTELRTLINIGAVYEELERNQEALNFYSEALFLSRRLKYPQGEIGVLQNLMGVYSNLNKPHLAIFYGKQSINSYQQIRANISNLDKDVQKNYLKSIEIFYRYLANLLISEGRLSEAVQVLNSFKDQQFFDFERSQIKEPTPLIFTEREARFVSRFEKTGERAGVVDEQLEALKQKRGGQSPNPAETAQIQKLENELQTVSNAFAGELKQAESEFTNTSFESDKLAEIPDLVQMQAALRLLREQTGQKAAAIYQLVGEEKFSALLISEDKLEKVSVSFAGIELDEKARQLWELLQTDKYDTTILSKELYDVVFKPIEAKIPKDLTTIMWSLDGNLRYVPMAALWDGKQFLAERFNHVIFTRADTERLTRAVKSNWNGTGFGTTEPHTVELSDRKINFSALPGVRRELDEIFKGSRSRGRLLKGKVLFDAKFTKDSFMAALRQKRPVVHIASHFLFRPGDEHHSFLLLGDGQPLTLTEMKKDSNLFQGVELLALSACNTAAAQKNANGKEIDGFAELAQRLGASSIMATLWSVSDASTPWLMQEFYAAKLSKQGITKAEALKRAQLGLLNGTAQINPMPLKAEMAKVTETEITAANEKKSNDDKNDRAEIVEAVKKEAPLFIKDAKKPYAHPYYWAPFILIGNWK